MNAKHIDGTYFCPVCVKPFCDFEITDMQDDGDTVVTCDRCNTEYVIVGNGLGMTDAEWDALEAGYHEQRFPDDEILADRRVYSWEPARTESEVK